jgi:hypothetical protein
MVNSSIAELLSKKLVLMVVGRPIKLGLTDQIRNLVKILILPTSSRSCRDGDINN